MAGEFTAGLSGGQRKLLLFELIYQRVMAQKDLLIVLDEPFAGVTDDFVPFIVDRLNKMRESHNILLVTNDHVQTLSSMADNIITVSAIDRTTVKINKDEKVDRDLALHAMSLGAEYVYSASSADLKFFWDVEVAQNAGLMGIAAFTIIAFSLFLLTFWDASPGNEALVLIGGGIIAYFCLQPYLLTLPDWRKFMCEEAEALMHSSVNMNKRMKTALSLVLMIMVVAIYFGLVNLVIDTLSSVEYFVAIFFDMAALTLPLVFIAIYTNLGLEAVQLLGSLPFLLMIFFSTTFSPGSGVPGVKALRYLFPRFYFWCIVPVVDEQMEGCPEENLNTLYLILSSLIGLVIFFVVMGISALRKKLERKAAEEKKKAMMDDTFHALQNELYGEKVLSDLNLAEAPPTSHSSEVAPQVSEDSP